MSAIKHGTRLFIKVDKTGMSFRPRPVAASPSDESRLAHVLNTGMCKMPALADIGAIPSSVTKSELPDKLKQSINKIIGMSGQSDKLWILISTARTDIEKLKLLTDRMRDRNAIMLPEVYNDLNYFMWTTSGKTEDQINEFTKHLNNNRVTKFYPKINYVFIVADFNAITAQWTWRTLEGFMLKTLKLSPQEEKERMP